MKFLFDDESFSFEALRAAGYASRGGADLGEVLAACAGIPDGDEEAWCRECGALAHRIYEAGLAALTAGHRVSARDALLRASNYYRTAEFYRRGGPDHDAESQRLAGLSRESFAAAAELLDVPARRVSIPYEGTTLPGYLFRVDDSGTARPTVVYHGGFYSTLEEGYFAAARGRLSAATTCWHSTVPDRRRPAGCRAWCSARTGRRSSPRSSTTPSLCLKSMSTEWC